MKSQRFGLKLVLLGCLILKTNVLYASFNRPQPQLKVDLDQLISIMTLEEKAGQLQMLDGRVEGDYPDEYLELAAQGLLGSTLNIRGAKNVNPLQKMAVENSRLGIPILFAFDVIHGHRTIFPVPLAGSCSWNLELIEKASAVAAKEAASTGLKLTFAPMADIALDPRWGRIVEGVGEDPYLASEIIRAKVIGFQGTDVSELKSHLRVAATLKHWVAYGAAQGGRDYNTTDVSIQRLHDLYFKPFLSGVKAGATSVMTAFNALGGVPCTAHPYTQMILRDQWGFDGLVMSDYESVLELINHGSAQDEAQAAQKAIESGVDIEMVSRTYVQNIPELVRRGVISEKTLNQSVKKVLELKEKLGLFENPYLDPDLEAKTLMIKEHQQVAKALARESIVLLKNEGNLLPLDRSKVKKIAVIGPFINDRRNLLGSWTGDGQPQDVQTIQEVATKNYSKDFEWTFYKGVKATGQRPEFKNARNEEIEVEENEDPWDDEEGIIKSTQLALESDLVVMALGEPANYSGEAASRVFLDLPGRQLELLKAVYATKKPVVLVLLNGRPLAIPWIGKNIPVIVESWYLGTFMAQALWDVLTGQYNPSGKLTVTFPRSVGQVPIFYRHLNTGRPYLSGDPAYLSVYLDSPNTPLFPFGYGLSYSKFEMKELRVIPQESPLESRLKVKVTLQNHGPFDGQEVVQIYFQDVASEISRPVRELVAFKKIFLAANTQQELEFDLKATDLHYLDYFGNTRQAQGVVHIFAGNNSVDTLKATVDLGSAY